MRFFRGEKFALFLILSLGFFLRLYKINNPVADWHSWRQADTAAVTRNFVNKGIDLLHPQFDDLSSVASGKPNPSGFRFVEFPIYNALSAIVAQIGSSLFTLEVWCRLVSVCFSLFSSYLLFSIAKYFLGVRIGLLSSFFFVFLPYSIYYSRVILPEPMMVFFSLGMVWFFIRGKEKEGKKSTIFFVLATVFSALGLLLKPIVAFLFFPLYFFSVQKFGWKIWKRKEMYFFLFFSSLPLLLWRWWISHFPEGIPAYLWLLNQDKIRFKGSWFWWIFAKRLGELILGFWGLIPFGIGLVLRPGKKEGWFFHFWFLAILLYFAVFATGNVRHDYYQIISLPIICIFLGKGVNFLLSPSRRSFSPTLGYILLPTSILFMFAFSWYKVRTYYWINRPEIIRAGEAVDALVPKEAKVIAPYNGDTAFLYQTKRKGWPLVEAPLEEMKRWGADYLVSVEVKDRGIQALKRKYKVLKETGEYIIFDLRRSL